MYHGVVTRRMRMWWSILFNQEASLGELEQLISYWATEQICCGRILVSIKGFEQSFINTRERDNEKVKFQRRLSEKEGDLGV